MDFQETCGTTGRQLKKNPVKFSLKAGGRFFLNIIYIYIFFSINVFGFGNGTKEWSIYKCQHSNEGNKEKNQIKIRACTI